MDRQLVRSHEDLTLQKQQQQLQHYQQQSSTIKSVNGQSIRKEDLRNALHSDYALKYGQNNTLPLNVGSTMSTGVVRMAPLAQYDDKFDEKDLLETPRHNVKLYKGLLVFFSSVILLVGLAISALGVYFILDPERVQLHQLILLTLLDPEEMVSGKADIQPMLYFLTLGLIGSGLFMSLVALWSLLAATKESKALIFINVFFMTLLLSSQLTLGFFGVTFHLRANEDLRHELVTRLQRYYNEPGGEYFSPALDYAQTRFQCCGITGESDYENSFWKKQSLGGEDLIFPLTCCALSNLEDAESYLNPMPRHKENCMSITPRINRIERHQQGCLEDILDWSTLEFVVIIAISLGSALLEILGICITIYMFKHVRRRDQYR